MPATHTPRPISPAIGRTKRDRPGLSIRVTAIVPPPGNSNGARHRQMTRPATTSSSAGGPACVDGLQGVISVRATLVDPIVHLGPEGSGAALAGHEVGRIE